VHQLEQYEPCIHEACEKTLKVILKNFLNPKNSVQVLQNTHSSSQKKRPTQ
jgi:hypothetical protein